MNDLTCLLFFIVIFYIISHEFNHVLTIESSYISNNIRKKESITNDTIYIKKNNLNTHNKNLNISDS
jgi:hypothetical protein